MVKDILYHNTTAAGQTSTMSRYLNFNEKKDGIFDYNESRSASFRVVL